MSQHKTSSPNKIRRCYQNKYHQACYKLLALSGEAHEITDDGESEMHILWEDEYLVFFRCSSNLASFSHFLVFFTA